MNMAAQAFANYLEQKDIKYSIHGNDNHIILVSYSGENMSDINIWFNFYPSTRNVSIRIVGIARIPEEKIYNVSYELSQLNHKYRWVKFYLDSDNDVTAETDAIITPSTVSDICHELLRRTRDIVDETYPEIMKMLWG